MPTEFTIPELGENVNAGDVVRVLVKPGEMLKKDQPVLELETDKATIEVPSSVEGTVQDIKVKQGDKVKVGQVVLTVAEGAGAAPQPADKPSEAAQFESGSESASKEEPPKPQTQPAGAAEEGGLSQRATPEEKPAEPSKAPQTKRRGEVVDISRGARPQQAAAAAPAADQAVASTPAPAAPSVRRMARELGVDINRVTGTGEGGRISPDDVHEFVRRAMSGASDGSGAPAPGGPMSQQPLPDFNKWGAVDRQPMSNIRRKTAEHLSHAWNTIPHVTQHDRADITNVEALRKQYGPQAEKAGGKLTMTAIALKVVAAALKKFPQFNASADPSRNEIVYRKFIHVGVAVDTERGLLVPVVRDVDTKGVLELAAELSKVSEKARAGKLTLDEMQGGGFTITNLGGVGGTSFTPIVNWPEVAILGISRGSQEPVFNGQSFEPRLMLPLSLSYDHRVIDGADAARFLRWVCEAFEQPFTLVL